MRATLRSLSLAALASLLAVQPALSQAPTAGQSKAAVPSNDAGPVYIYPLEVKLVHSLDTENLKPGDHVLTKLSHVWSDGDCNLAAGVALSGEVASIHVWTKQDKQTRVTLQFRYTCRETARALRLITLLAPEIPDLLGIHGNQVEMQAMRSSLFGEGNPLKPAGNTIDNHVDMSGQQNPQWPLFVSSEPNIEHRPTEVKRGMVWHLPGIGLTFSDAATPISSIVSSHRSFKLPSETVLVMQPELQPDATAPKPATTGPRAFVARPQLAALTPEINACPAASCTDLPSAAPSPTKSEQEFSLRRFGSLRGQTGEIAGLEYSAAITFVGPDELLVCVGKPGLVARTGAERPEDHPHLVEAILYNRHTGHVERTAEWAVPNRERYLWPLADGRILVHDADRLIWYRHGLTPEHTMPLHAPLAYVHTTGDGRHLLIGTVRELHTPAEHAELYKNDSRAPEEEVQSTVYDENLQPVSEWHESSRTMPPLLWNTGRLSLRHRSNAVWYFRETLWNGEGRNFGTVVSSCVPKTTALSGDLLLVIGCETHSLNAWARVLRTDGSLVLRTTVRPSDLYPVAPSVSAQNIVLVSPRLNPAANRDGALHAADITGESVRVLRSSDGHLGFSTDVHQPTTSAQSAAIDAQGTTLAVLDGDTVRLYTLDPASPTPQPNVPAATSNGSR